MALLKGKKLKERYEWFETWKSTIAERLDSIISKIEKETSKSLDFSPESLKVVEEFLQSRYSKSSQIKMIAEEKIGDGVSTYIGEVFIRNIDADVHWGVGEEEGSKVDLLFNFYPYIKGNANYVGLNPFTHLVPYAIANGDGNSIYDTFIKNSNYYKEKSGNSAPSQEISAIPAIDNPQYNYFVLLPSKENPLEKVIDLIDNLASAKKWKKYSSKIYKGTHAVVSMSSYNFHIIYNGSDDVQDENLEIAGEYDGKKDNSIIAKSKARLEFMGDQDPNGDYINEHMFILESLMDDFPYIFNHKEGYFYDE